MLLRPFGIFLLPGRDIGPQFQIFLNGQGTEKLAIFGNLNDPQADQLLSIRPADILSHKKDFSFTGRVNPGEAIEQGCFTGPVGPDQRDDLALTDFQRDPFQGPVPSVMGF